MDPETSESPITAPKILKLSTCTVDLGKQIVISGDEQIKLGRREVRLLQYLGARPRQVIPREEIFTEVWGYDPSTLSRDVDHTVKRLRSKIEADSANPKHLFSLYGQGYRFVPLSSTKQTPQAVLSTNVAELTSPILGRNDEIAALEQLLKDETRIVTLLGSGGLGKTRLSQEIARRAAMDSTFAGGTWFCDLVECRSFRDILHTVSDVLGIRLQSTDDPIGSAHALGRAIATRGDMFIVLDNFEQVADFASQTIGVWHQLAESVQFLVTSRTRLAVPSEVVYQLTPLSPKAGCELFVQRASIVSPKFELTHQNTTAIHQIVDQLESIPLAILLAAGRTASMTPEHMVDRLQQRFQLLRQGPRISESRQDTMQAAIDWSWDLLEDVERSVLQQCAVFRSGFTLEAAESIIDVPEVESAPLWIADILQGLADKSMLYVENAKENALDHRICAFDNIRYYALERFEDERTLLAARKRHAEYFRPWARQQVEGLNHDLAHRCLHRLRYEVDNLVAAFETSIEHNPSSAMPLAEAIERVYFANGWFQGNVEIMEALIPASDVLSKDDLCSLYHLLGRNHQTQGHHEAEQRAKQALKTLIQDEPDHPKNVSVLIAQTNQLTRLGQHGEASDRLQAFLSQRPGLSAAEQCSVHAKLGLIRYMLQDLPTAAAHLEHAITLAKGNVDQSWRSSLTANLGAIYIALGQIKLGQKHLQYALTQHEQFGNRSSVAIALVNLAQADLRLKEPQHAAIKLQRAIALIRDSRRVSVLVEAMMVLVTAHAIAGEMEAAFDALEQARIACRDESLHLALVQALEAGLLAANGDKEAAASLWAEAAPEITPMAVLNDAQWQTLGHAHLDLKQASKLFKNPTFCVPRHPHECPTEEVSGREYHHLHILFLEHRVAVNT